MPINMIRTTISRIKRVWAITFSPCLLRGDLRCTPGKFQMLTSTTQNPPLTRSKSVDTISRNGPKQAKVGSGGNKEDAFEDYLPSNMESKSALQGAPPLYRKSPACRCDECNKIITDIFGAEIPSEKSEPKLKEKLLTNITQVNMTNNIESTFITDTIRIGSFNKKEISDSKLQSTLTKNNTDIESANIIKDKDKKRCDQVGVDAFQMYTNLYDVVPEGYQFENIDPYKKLYSKGQNVDSHWRKVYETAVGENSVYCEPTMCVDEDTLNVYKVFKKSTSIDDARRFKFSPRELEKMMNERDQFITDKKTDKVYTNQYDEAKHIFKASTYKQNDEKLMQKLEHIDEAPLVVGEKCKEECLQVMPKVIGKTQKPEVSNNLDEIAKRCLSSPTSHDQLDEILLKEMEKPGIPSTVQKYNCELKPGDNKTDASNKLEKTPEVEEDKSVSHESMSTAQSSITSDKPNNLEESKELETNPLETKGQNFSGFQLATDLNEEKDKYATKTNVYDANSAYKSGWSFWPHNNSQQQPPACSGTVEPDYNTNLTQKFQLDPKHVLTCNETCSISPKPLICNSDVKNIEGTGAVAEKQNINRDEYMNPLLEDGQNNSIATKPTDSSGFTLRYTDTDHHFDDTKTTQCKEITENSTKRNSIERHTHDSKSTNSMIPPELDRKESTLGSDDDYEHNTNLTKDQFNTYTNEQLQYTSERLEAASQHLQATCENLQSTTERLQATTSKLHSTSYNLFESSDKLQSATENLNNSTENLQFTTEHLRDTTGIPHISTLKKDLAVKASSYLQYPNISSTEAFITGTLHSPTNAYKSTHPQCATPATVAVITKSVSNTCSMKDSQSDKTSIQDKSKHKKAGEDAKDDDKDLEEIVNESADDKNANRKSTVSNMETWTQQAATTINPSVPITEDVPQTKPLPQVNDNLKLSDLLKIVRQKNRLKDSREATVLVKSKNIPPLAKPLATQNPAFKMPGYPEIKPMPKKCGSKKKPPTTTNCSRCNLKILGLDNHVSHIGHQEECPETISLNGWTIRQDQSVDLTQLDDLPTNLIEDLCLQFHVLRNELESSYKYGQSMFLETAVLAKTRHIAKIFRSPDYEPWSPIPSWPYPKKYKRQKLQCPKDGCKAPPPRSIEDRPCGLKPCESFPTFPNRTYSLIDCYLASISKHKVEDI